jgi:hypothetical protein
LDAGYGRGWSAHRGVDTGTPLSPHLDMIRCIGLHTGRSRASIDVLRPNVATTALVQVEDEQRKKSPPCVKK